MNRQKMSREQEIAAQERADEVARLRQRVQEIQPMSELVRCPNCKTHLLTSQLEPAKLMNGHSGPWLGIPNTPAPAGEAQPDLTDALLGNTAGADRERPPSTPITGDTSDGYHTFTELYAYRKAFNALLFNEWARLGLYDVHKSRRHSDGEPCFGGGWFIVVAQTPAGQVSNHYKDADWPLFQVPERERGAEWDGHTPQTALDRLLTCAAGEAQPDLHIHNPKFRCPQCEAGEAQTPPAGAPCRVCRGYGFVAEKQCIDDGYGEVDSCPACQPPAGEGKGKP